MAKKTIKLTKDDLREIVTTATKQVLNEMAVERGVYIQYGINQSATVLKHIGKICVFEGDDRMSHLVKHWENEIAAQIYDLGKIDIKRDNKACKIKKKAFVESFIEARLGEGFSEYDEKMYSYIQDGLSDEGLSKEQINAIDTKGIAAANKERIKNYLYSFVELLSITDLNELKEQSKIVAYQF